MKNAQFLLWVIFISYKIERYKFVSAIHVYQNMLFYFKNLFLYLRKSIKLLGTQNCFK